MVRIQTPASYTVRKTVTINGTVYQPGAAITNATVKGIKRLSALLGNRTIVPNVDPFRRRTKNKHTAPLDLGGAKLRKTL